MTRENMLAQFAVQPPKLPKVNGSFCFKPTADWDAFVAGMADFRFRESNPRNWVGPFYSTGECLAPFSESGDLVYIDPTLEPRDGDLVLVAWGPKALASEQFQRAARDWRESYGTDPGPIATKRLRRMGSDWLLAVRNSFFWLDDCRVLGVMVAKERGGLALHAPVSCAIGPKAATDVGSVVVDTDSHNFPSAVGVQDRTFTAFDYTNGLAHEVTIEVSVSGSRRYTTPAGLSGTADALSRISISNITDSVSVTSTQDFMQQQIEDQPANTSQIYFESTVFSVVIPAGKQYRFTPIFRSITNVGSTGTLTVDTDAYTMRLAAVKR